ncbi:Helix-turn-helix domain-containing protein [Streptomyces sp. Ag82_O1-12]|nr:Helix-turn-helix domain-containing protein [Streptomyces sp. Ag82_O1-12]SOD45978.1 Helix-turn-helix domain-containing protein [Streptomyces sp. Ag82_G6-1]
MNHSTWRTRRARQLAGEAVEYDQQYVDARLAGDLGQAVHNRRTELGLSQADLAERAGMTQPQVCRMDTQFLAGQQSVAAGLQLRRHRAYSAVAGALG